MFRITRVSSSNSGRRPCFELHMWLTRQVHQLSLDAYLPNSLLAHCVLKARFIPERNEGPVLSIIQATEKPVSSGLIP